MKRWWNEGRENESCARSHQTPSVMILGLCPPAELRAVGI
jgi:hypothetical protein